MKDKIILGLAGHPSSGKDSAAKFLIEECGFTQVSTSDMIREYTTKNNLGDHSRENLQKVANSIREKFGGGFLVEEALKINASKIAITGIRSTGEVSSLKKGGGHLLVVTAPIEKRYEWARLRGRIGENISFEEFKRIEDKEASNEDPNAQNVDAVIAQADFRIENDGTLEDLKHKVSDLVSKLSN